MCGLVGFVGDFQPGLMDRMNRRQGHRGPDGAGTFEDAASGIGLGHVRLSVLDLSHAAHQPMVDSEAGSVVVFNGEIYNFRDLRKELMATGHRFVSTGDTEVLLRGLIEHGSDFLSRLNGMFAFAWWNSRTQELVLARDPLGIKPLYYTQQASGGLLFASEIKALFAHPHVEARADFRALQQHLAYCHASAERTAFAGVNRLPPGHLLQWRKGRCRIRPYWKAGFSAAHGGSFAQGLDRVRETVGRALDRQLVSDVPVGAFLSGGLDSSLITVLAAQRAGRRLRCYTSTYPSSDNRLDQAAPDGPYARRLARQLGLDLVEIRLEADVAELLPKLVYHLDEPIADPAIIACYLISQRAIDDGTKVLLSGQGADELFCGYPRYRAMHSTGWVDRLPMALRRGAARASRFLPGAREGSLGALLRRGKRVLSELDRHADARFLGYCANSPQHEVTRVLSRDVRALLGGESYQSDCLDAMRASALEGMARFRARDLGVYLPNHNLLYTDKMGMAVGLEARVPLLDQELVELVPGFPLAWLVGMGRDKVILREAARGIVPDAIIDRPKAGFGAPYRKWLRYDMAELWHELTSREAVARRGWFDYDALLDARRRSQAGRADLYMLQWGVMTMELWARQFFDGAATAAEPPAWSRAGQDLSRQPEATPVGVAG